MSKYSFKEVLVRRTFVFTLDTFFACIVPFSNYFSVFLPVIYGDLEGYDSDNGS